MTHRLDNLSKCTFSPATFDQRATEIIDNAIDVIGCMRPQNKPPSCNEKIFTKSPMHQARHMCRIMNALLIKFVNTLEYNMYDDTNSPGIVPPRCTVRPIESYASLIRIHSVNISKWASEIPNHTPHTCLTYSNDDKGVYTKAVFMIMDLVLCYQRNINTSFDFVKCLIQVNSFSKDLEAVCINTKYFTDIDTYCVDNRINSHISTTLLSLYSTKVPHVMNMGIIPNDHLAHGKVDIFNNPDHFYQMVISTVDGTVREYANKVKEGRFRAAHSTNSPIVIATLRVNRITKLMVDVCRAKGYNIALSGSVINEQNLLCSLTDNSIQSHDRWSAYMIEEAIKHQGNTNQSHGTRIGRMFDARYDKEGMIDEACLHLCKQGVRHDMISPHNMPIVCAQFPEASMVTLVDEQPLLSPDGAIIAPVTTNNGAHTHYYDHENVRYRVLVCIELMGWSSTSIICHNPTCGRFIHKEHNIVCCSLCYKALYCCEKCHDDFNDKHTPYCISQCSSLSTHKTTTTYSSIPPSIFGDHTGSINNVTCSKDILVTGIVNSAQSTRFVRKQHHVTKRGSRSSKPASNKDSSYDNTTPNAMHDLTSSTGYNLFDNYGCDVTPTPNDTPTPIYLQNDHDMADLFGDVLTTSSNSVPYEPGADMMDIGTAGSLESAELWEFGDGDSNPFA